MSRLQNLLMRLLKLLPLTKNEEVATQQPSRRKLVPHVWHKTGAHRIFSQNHTDEPSNMGIPASLVDYNHQPLVADEQFCS